MVADCLPVFLASRDGDRVGLAHAGWRGLAAGVVEATVAALDCEPGSLVAWLGPSIGPDGIRGRARSARRVPCPRSGRGGAFPRRAARAASSRTCRRSRGAGSPRAGVTDVHGGGHCTHSDPARFYSYRRDGATGRMAALAWLA